MCRTGGFLALGGRERWWGIEGCEKKYFTVFGRRGWKLERSTRIARYAEDDGCCSEEEKCG